MKVLRDKEDIENKSVYLDYIMLDNTEFSEGETVRVEVLKNMPDLLTYWKPECDFGIEYSVEIFERDTPCEECCKMGAYVLRDDHASRIGVCRKHLEQDKTVLKVVELPNIHKY